MEPCRAFMPGGINRNCIAELGEVKNVIITEDDVEFSSISDALNLSTWKTKVMQDLSVYVPRKINDYEVTTDDPNIVTFQNTRKRLTNKPLPSATVMLQMNFCDYKEILGTLVGGTYGVIYELSDGSYLATKTSAGKIKPLLATINAIAPGIPLKGDVGNNFKIYIGHLDYKEFEDAILLSPAWDLTFELTNSMPVGYTLEQTGAYDTAADGDVTVRITERCGDGVESLTDSDFEVVDSNDLDTPAITAVSDDSNGNYTITLQKEATPTNLAAGDYIIFRVKKTSDSDITHLSNRVTVIAP